MADIDSVENQNLQNQEQIGSSETTPENPVIGVEKEKKVVATTGVQPAQTDDDAQPADDDAQDDKKKKDEKTDILKTYIPVKGRAWPEERKAMFLANVAVKQLSKNKKMKASIVQQAMDIMAKAREIFQLSVKRG